MTSNEARCKYTDLPLSGCGCDQHHRPERTVVSIAALERLAGHPLPQYRAIRRPEWRVPEPKETICDHRADDLCNECDALLDALLADLPHLVEELGFAMRKDVRFKPHGHRRGDTEHPDEAPLPWSPAAASVLGDIRNFMIDPPGHRTEQLAELSWIAQKAHRVIDRPKERQETLCPRCSRTIAIPDGDPQSRTVICQACAYTATWQQHLTDILDASGDAMLTEAEIRFVLGTHGEPITKQRLSYLATRHGLAREQIAVPQWVEGRLVTHTQYAYRLSDVRALQESLERKAAG